MGGDSFVWYYVHGETQHSVLRERERENVSSFIAVFVLRSLMPSSLNGKVCSEDTNVTQHDISVLLIHHIRQKDILLFELIAYRITSGLRKTIIQSNKFSK